MNKYLRVLLISFFLLMAVPPAAVSAAAGGELAVDRQGVTITLRKPQEETYAVSALRFRMYVTVSAGSMEQPTFQFAGSDSEEVVRNVSVTNTKDGRYLADVIISGKKGWDIFGDGGQAVIGTLSLHPLDGQFHAVVQIAEEETKEGLKPALRYVSSVDYSVQVVPVEGVQSVKITSGEDGASEQPSNPETPETPGSSDNSDSSGSSGTSGTPGSSDNSDSSGSSGTPGIPGTPTVPGTPDTTVRPGVPGTPGNIGTPGASETPGTGNTDSSGTEDAKPDGSDFSSGAAPQLGLTVKSGARRVRFQWSLVAGADGYQIYEYQEDTGKYKRLKTIFQAQATGYSRKMEYGTTYTFKLRAFQTKQDGSRMNGAFSQAVTITTPPSKVKGLNVKSQPQGALLTWKRMENADGYQIYQSTEKYKKYTRRKTIKKGSVRKFSDNQPMDGKVYYKVRAYVVGADGKRVYGAFSSIKKMR